MLFTNRPSHTMLTPETQRQFVALLATLYPDRASIVRIAQSAGMRVELVALESSAVNSWHATLQEATKQNRLAQLLLVVG